MKATSTSSGQRRRRGSRRFCRKCQSGPRTRNRTDRKPKQCSQRAAPADPSPLWLFATRTVSVNQRIPKAIVRRSNGHLPRAISHSADRSRNGRSRPQRDERSVEFLLRPMMKAIPPQISQVSIPAVRYREAGPSISRRPLCLCILAVRAYVGNFPPAETFCRRSSPRSARPR